MIECVRLRPYLPAVLAAAFVAVFVRAGSLQAVGGPFWMNAAELEETFSGRTITGHYIDGRTFKEQYFPDGSIDYRESVEGRHWTGHWSVVADRFCTIYEGSGTGGCFRVHRASANCYEFYFETRTEEEVRRAEPKHPLWTAQGWRVDTPSTCSERPMV